MKRILLFIVLSLTLHIGLGQNTSGQDEKVTSSLLRTLDTDGDGYNNTIDLDDDNDGILDTKECSISINISTNGTVLTATNINDVQVNEKVVFTDAITKNDVVYDVVFTLLEKSNSSSTVQASDYITVVNVIPNNNDYIKYSLEVVEKNSATPVSPNGTPVILDDVIFVLSDIDSTNPWDVAEVTGIETGLTTSPDNSYLETITQLEKEGFEGGNPMVGNYDLYRLQPNQTIPYNNWSTNGGTTVNEQEYEAYFYYTKFTKVNVIFGVTGGQLSALTSRKNSLKIDSKCDRDNDGLADSVDIDSDNDGIPDNIEAQPSSSYIAPSATVDANGINSSYSPSGLTNLVDTDSDGDFDYIDFDSDNDGLEDREENGMVNSHTANTDTDNDGLDDNFEGSNLNDPYNVNEGITNPEASHLSSGGRVSYRSAADNDGDGYNDDVDLDDDNDGILDIDECNVILSFDNESKLTASTNLSNLQVGHKVLYSSAVIFNDIPYDIVLTITATSFTNTSTNIYIHPTFKSLTFTKRSNSDDEYFTFNMTLVEAGSATMGDPTGVPASIDNFTLEFRDLDSDQYSDFTEVLAFETGLPTSPNNSYLSAGTFLEAGGFRPTYGPATGSYTFYRMKKNLAGSPTNWHHEKGASYPNPQQEKNTVYMEFDSFQSVNLIFGIAGATSAFYRETYYGSQVVCNDDNDSVPNRLDIDSDNDGIPDNVEAQPTVGYIPPPALPMPVNSDGIPTVYGSGISPLQDTDGDGIRDFKDTNSDNDGLLDIEENGMANTIVTITDTDNDGLDDIFEGGNVSDPKDVNDEIDTPASSILPDGNGDVLTGGDLDYRDIFNAVNKGDAIVDFDGVDDYISSPLSMVAESKLTLMGWVKLDANFNAKGTAFGENICRLFIDNAQKVKFRVLVNHGGTDGDSYELYSATPLNKNQWYHITGVYNGTIGKIKLYVNGVEVGDSDMGTTGTLASLAVAGASPNFAIGRVSKTENEYFKGAIDEVRVFDEALTASQIQRMIYQEIEKNGSKVIGKLIPIDISDADTSAKIAWNSLQAYYPMTDIDLSQTTDYSGNGNTATLHNIKTLQQQTAPMPYITSGTGSGVWSDASTWLHGDVWDFNDLKDWSIVKLSHNIETKTAQHTGGLIIDPSVKLTVGLDASTLKSNALYNTWYLGLNGTIDLLKDSQLIQTNTSHLATSADGKILRRQQGTNNEYWYNFWSVPVGALGATSYNVNENNATINNSNNTPFKLNMLKNEAGSAMQFTNALQEQNKISKRWLHIFRNGTVYADWQRIDENSNVLPGEGYSQKGTAALTPKQGYIFEGKPNNGTVLLNAIKQASSKSTKYLVGNPYASAIDARKFIDDNLSVIDGTIYLWEQWAGNSHETATYEGGYATINKTTTVRAAQFPGIPIAGQAQTIGIKKPTFYLPVGQAFLVRVTNTGDLVFKNSQRVFAKASDADGTPNNGSVFVRQSQKADKLHSVSKNTYNPDMQIIRLEFKVSDGLSREFVVAFSDKTTEAYDNGYDSKMRRIQTNDCYTVLDESAMIIQSYSKLTADKKVDILFNSTGDKLYSLKMTEATNIPENQDIYLYDKLTDTYFNLKDQEIAYNFVSNVKGWGIERFSVVFKSKKPIAELDEETYEATLVFVDNKQNKLFVKNIEDKVVKTVRVINTLGKTVQTFNNVTSENMTNGLLMSSLSSGAYVVQLITANNAVVTKKVIIN